MKTHVLKTWPLFFGELAAGKKTFEVRQDDRGFAVGDQLILMEFDPDEQAHTGREIRALVCFKMVGGAMGIDPGYCVLSLTGIREIIEQPTKR